MSNQGELRIVGHIRFPFDEDIKKLFFDEVQSEHYEWHCNGRKICTSKISNELKVLLTKEGFSFKRVENTILKGRKEVYGVKIYIQKNYKNKKIWELIIGIPAETRIELEKKKELIVSRIRKAKPDIKIDERIAEAFGEDCS